MSEPLAVLAPAMPSDAVDMDVPPTCDEIAEAVGLAMDPRLTVWRSLLVAQALVTRRLDDEMREDHGISLAEYDALLQLAAAPDQQLRMNQLADRVLLSRSGVTRLVDRLEAGGLVARTSCASDARGAQAVLTTAGFARLKLAVPTHLSGIERHFLSALDGADTVALERTLDGIVETAARGTPFEACRTPSGRLDPA